MKKLISAKSHALPNKRPSPKICLVIRNKIIKSPPTPEKKMLPDQIAHDGENDGANQHTKKIDESWFLIALAKEIFIGKENRATFMPTRKFNGHNLYETHCSLSLYFMFFKRCWKMRCGTGNFWGLSLKVDRDSPRIRSYMSYIFPMLFPLSLSLFCGGSWLLGL